MMQRLMKGIHQFQKDAYVSRRELFARLAEGQTPDTLFITCSDSRIDPNMLTQSEPGDLFILRNAGNLVPPHGAPHGGEEATIEFAVAALGVRDIIICGHSQCGAMKGLLKPESITKLPAITAWLSHADTTRRIIEENYNHLDEAARVNAAIQENVLVQLENLRTHPVIAPRLSRGDLHLHGWVYKIETGEVFAYSPQSGQFVPLVDYEPTATPERRGAAHAI